MKPILIALLLMLAPVASAQTTYTVWILVWEIEWDNGNGVTQYSHGIHSKLWGVKDQCNAAKDAFLNNTLSGSPSAQCKKGQRTY